jgi:hypothetical protein
MRLLVGFAFLAFIQSLVLAADWRVGVVGGVGLTREIQVVGPTSVLCSSCNPPTLFETNKSSRFPTPLLGVKLEYEKDSWSVETGILFRQPNFVERFRSSPAGPENSSVPITIPRFFDSSTTYNEAIFEVPLLAKYRFQVARQPLIFELGPTLRPFGGADGPGVVGLTVGLGTKVQLGKVRLMPSVRYTRWTKNVDQLVPFRNDQVNLVVSTDFPLLRKGGQTVNDQSFSVGFLGGTTLTTNFPDKNGFGGRTSRLAGVALEFQFRPRWSVELDVMYHPLILSERARATVLTWEMPLLLKHRFSTGSVRPFLAGGPGFRASGNRNSTNPSLFGVSVSGGVEIRTGKFGWEPTLRYNRWNQDKPSFNSPAFANPSQLQILLGIRFGK